MMRVLELKLVLIMVTSVSNLVVLLKKTGWRKRSPPCSYLHQSHERLFQHEHFLAEVLISSGHGVNVKTTWD